MTIELIDKVQEEIINDFKGLDWFEKYELLISLAKELKPMDEKFKVEENTISGCQSKVWIISYKVNGNLNFEIESDTLITKGILALVLKVLNNRPVDEILNTNLYFIDEIGLRSNLSPARANGLESVINAMKEIAIDNIEDSA